MFYIVNDLAIYSIIPLRIKLDRPLLINNFYSA